MTLDAESDPFEALVPQASAAPASTTRVNNPFEASAPNASAASVSTAPVPSGDPFEALVSKQSGLGTFGVLKEAGRRGLAEGLTSAAQGFTPFENRPVNQQEQDQVSQLLTQPVSKGWSDPKWWASHIAHGAAASSPSLATGAAGAYLGSAAGPWGTLGGGAAGFAGGTALQTLAPAYQKARQEGFSHEDAVDRAIKESGISASFAAAMGLAPGVSVFGKTAEGALRRPISEALGQIFGVQPGLGVGQAAAVKAYEGKGAITPEEAAQAYAEQAGVGAALVGSHALISGGARATGLGRKAPEGSPQEAVPHAAEPAAENAYPDAPESIRAFHEATKKDIRPEFFTPAEHDPFEALVPKSEATVDRTALEQNALIQLEDIGLRDQYDVLTPDEKIDLQDRVAAGENAGDVVESLAVRQYNDIPAVPEGKVQDLASGNDIPWYALSGNRSFRGAFPTGSEAERYAMALTDAEPFIFNAADRAGRLDKVASDIEAGKVTDKTRMTLGYATQDLDVLAKKMGLGEGKEQSRPVEIALQDAKMARDALQAAYDAKDVPAFKAAAQDFKSALADAAGARIEVVRQRSEPKAFSDWMENHVPEGVKNALADPSYALKGDTEARTNAVSQLAAGNDVRIAPRVVSAVRQAHEEIAHAIPEVFDSWLTGFSGK